jgi:signal peptide peptidase-like 3
MLLALVLFFDNRKFKDVNFPPDVSPPKRRNYVWYAVTGYGIGLVAALAAGILSQSPQPALLYLVSVARLYGQVVDIIANFLLC